MAFPSERPGFDFRDHQSYDYVPRFDQMVDRHPDHRPSSSRVECADRGRELVFAFEVRGLGALVMRAVGDPVTSRLAFSGVSTFTDEEIRHAGI